MKTIFHSLRIMASNALVIGYVSWLFSRTSGRFLKMTLLLVVLLLCGNVRAERLFEITSYDSNPVGWTSENITFGSYFKLEANSYMISPLLNPHNNVVLTCDVATFGSGTNHPMTIQVLNENGEIQETYTTGTPTSKDYISSTTNLGLINYNFKLKFIGASSKAVRLQNVKLVGEILSTESYTVTFNPGTGTCETPSLTESNPGAGVTLPTATSPCPSDWTFAGWSATEITTETTTAPQLYTEGSTYHPMANETLYAVYKKSAETEEQMIKEEGFEDFTTGTIYNSSEYVSGGENPSWTMNYGNFTSTGGVANSGSKAAQFRLYKACNKGELKTTTILSNVTKIEYYAKVNNTAAALSIYYSVDNGSSWVVIEEEKALTGNYVQYTAILDETQGIENVLIRFTAAGTCPNKDNYQISIDDITIYGMIGNVQYDTHPTCLPIMTPSIDISVSELDFVGTIDNNQTKELSFTLSAVHLTDNVTLSISGTDASFFTCMPINIAKEADGSIAETSIVVTYKPTSVGTHTALLTISSGELINTLPLYGVAEQPILAAPVATDATDVTNTSFTANWDAVTNATSYLVNVWTEIQVFSENFDSQTGTGGNDGSWSGSVASNSIIGLTDWTLSSAYGANQCIKLGTSSNQGVATTPALNVTGNCVLTFRAGAWEGDNNKLLLSLEGGGTLSETEVTLTNGIFQEYTIILTGINTDTKVSFKGEKKSDSRFFLDDVNVVLTNTCVGSPFTVSSGTSLNVTGLSPDTKYCYNVVAKADGYLDSDVSNTICTTTTNTSCVLATPIVTATPTTSTIYLQWSPVDRATSYIVSLNAATPLTVTGTSYTFTSLTPSTNYNWSVAASSDECTGIAATGVTETLEQPTVAGVEIVEVDINGLKLDFHEQDAIASVVIDNEVTVSEGERPIADDIFFSKYFEASGTAKLLGIYNGTNDSLPLADLEIWHRTADNAKLSLVGFGGTNPNFIMPNEEIIIYNEGSADVQNCAEEQENFDKWKPANVTANHPAIQFGGKGTITLRRGNEIIDIIGALDENGSLVEGNEQPTWGDDRGFTCAGGDNIKTDEIEDDYGLSTNRCLLIRRNHVKSGATAVAQNINAFNTLCTEWGGFHIDDDKDTQDQLTCEGFGYVGGFDYQGYYTQYVQLQTTEFDDLTQNADGTYTLPIPSLHKYSCTNIKLKTLDANGEVLETIIYKVPIIVNQDVTTAAEAFFHFEGDTCKNCDVVIRDEATLTTEAAGKTEFRNVEVYPQATLAVPESESLTVHSLRMRSNAVEDQMPYANIVGTLNNQTNMLYYDMRINNSAYRFFALPDTIKVGSIKFSNGMPAVSGTDFLVMYYDGEQRTTNGGLQSNWKPLSADSSIWAGNGYNIATAKAKMQELRFELEYDKVMGPDTKQVHVYDYGMNDYREGAITPNNVGWNLVGNPYLYIYENGTGDGLVYGKLEIADDGYIWNDTNLRYITYFNDEGRTYLQDKVGRRLRPFKCFFVQVGDPANEEKGLMYVTFNKYKAHNPDRQMVLAQRTPEPSEEQYVAVQLALGDKTDKMGITIDNAYTTEYEIGRDLEKMMNYGTLPHVYAYVNNSQKLAFNAVPEWAAQSVVAGAYFPEAGEYTISLDPNDRPTNRVMAVWLTDMINNVTTNLLLGDYSFYAQRAEQKNRFMIAVELAPEISTSTHVSSADGVYAYTQQRQMTICGLAENSVVSVYDALGHLVIQRNTSDASLTEQLPAAGMYLVKVVNAQQKATLKLLAY